MKYNSVKQSQPVILFTKPSLTKSFLLHTSLNFHLQIIFMYLFALRTWNVTALSVSEEAGEGKAVLQPLLCLWLFLNTFTSLLLHRRALEKAPTCVRSPCWGAQWDRWHNFLLRHTSYIPTKCTSNADYYHYNNNRSHSYPTYTKN